ncbi:GNAT family N-acetyltransferase [Bacillus sp. RO2]|jgi:N-acetylglutamate synthase-like GNAT family acetyltransferase|uniref:GNAT family N-acetyltransferase n=1 Tax=Bacillus sp. RO2 TaxID=2723913 RepID=UPI00145EAC34|nr:GNAT family N-acetyltransferase [Bacillus sp. RO2]NMH72733.1 GNAT family N-acetyltransferase [Bacillus sp. RO2]
MNILILDPQEIPGNFLSGFKRYQETKVVYVVDNNQLLKKEDAFVDDWNEQQKRNIASHLRKTAEKGGAVICVKEDGKVLGFSVIEPDQFGTESTYLELSFIHVSADYRGQKIGEKLFRKTMEKAREMGANKLYIGAHPAVETQHFYKKMGCLPAQEIHQPIYDREPRDVQLEVTL